MSTIWTAGRRGQARMQPTPAELGAQVRKALLGFYGSTRTYGVARDRTGVAMARSQYPASREWFSDAALAAVLREPQAGTCSWDAYRMLAAADGEEMPSPSPALEGLLGSQCRRCKIFFAAREVAERERGLMAAGYGRYQRPAATGMLWPAGKEPAGVVASARRAASRVPELPVRDAIRLARQRQQQREAAYR
jgi:hypothetical protein